MSSKIANFVYVEIGRKMPYFLKKSIIITRLQNPTATISYVSNLKINRFFQKKWNVHFIPFDSKKYIKMTSKVLQLFPERANHRGGYWVNSLIRLFALKDYIEQTGVTNFIHLESDSIALISQTDYESIIKLANFNSTCFDLDGQCVPTIIVIKDTGNYVNFLNFIEECIDFDFYRPDFFWNDMAALSLGKEKGFFNALPTYPHDISKQTDSSFSLIFDTAVYGKYLFGDDPRNSKFILRTGFRENPFSSPSDLKFQIKRGDDLFSLQLLVTINTDTFRLAILHNYAKRRVPFPRKNSLKWKIYLREANTDKFRIPTLSFSLLLLTFTHLIKRKFNSRLKIRSFL
jgi:hypothetical protein